jgi:PIN domain nuclease of toxin-antitoxin system
LNRDAFSPAARSLVRSTETVVLVSPVTVFEISQKQRIGKLPGMAAFVADVGATLARLRTEELALHHARARLAGTLASRHRNPFDRLLAARAILEEVPVLTVDPAFSDLGAVTLW